MRAEAALCRSASLKGLPFLYARFAPDEEVTAFSVCDISPPQFSNRDRFAEDTTVFCKRKLTAVCSHQTRIGNLDAHLI
ncbi:hypothetical protein EJ879_21110 [Shigella sonnei]|nr:hypothetical protein EJ879_21110 [Shigella sonnei]